MKQGALAHARRSDDGNHLALRHTKLEIAQHVKPLRTDLV
jgi:hypothetical protein